MDISIQEKNLEAMLNDCSIDAIIAVNPEKNIIVWNAMAEKIYGKSKQEVCGKPLLEIIPSMSEDEATLQAIELAVSGIKSFLPALKKYHHRKHAENHFIPLKDESNITIGVMNLVHDVAHRIKAEEQLQYLNDELQKQYRRLKTTSDELASFTYIASNKIKEPIRNIYTGVEHLIKAEASRLTDSGRATFRRMQTSLTRMDLLLDDLLNIAGISIVEKTDMQVDLTKLFNELCLEIKKKFDSRPVIHTGTLCTITGHKNYLHMLFYNLLNNAIKFNEAPEPTVNIACTKVMLDETLQNQGENEYYKITVSDDGIGFEGGNKEKIFTVFEKLNGNKYKGSGVGLTIARKIMDAHNGFITAESVHGKGAAFHCYFPVLD